ncbi:AAA family ATPase [Chamaesiphon sp.]|uniref:AAA family ATPase n=1 Tax=Chamaesiphon sp. TaxID=2814140 RepID=UPI003593FAC8
MLHKLRVQHYKSLFDLEVELEPLTVFIGPNGAGKSNICESLVVLSNFLQRLIANNDNTFVKKFFLESFGTTGQSPYVESKFWQGKLDRLSFYVKDSSYLENESSENNELFPLMSDISINFDYIQQAASIEADGNPGTGLKNTTADLRQFLVNYRYPNSHLANSLKQVSIYDFSPTALSSNTSNHQLASSMDRTGKGIAYALADILLTNRDRFNELEHRLTRLVPNIKRISLLRTENQSFSLELIDRYSEHHIPATDISDGTLRILGFLTALYQENTQSIICFEEIENGIHPWLLHKMVELLKIVSTEGITGNPVQVLITTYSPVLLNYVEPHQVRAVELDKEGKTQVHALPTDSVRFQKALEAYDRDLGELWFTNVFGGNPA